VRLVTDKSARFRRGPEAPAEARVAVAEWLGGAASREVIDDVKLLVSELVTNAVRHPRNDGFIGLEVQLRDGRVRVEVTDPGDGFKKPRIGSPPPDALGGRGLLIVDRIATAWGVSPGKPTRVWFEL
jgi:anti-sigma regulatory factor (Ser/Thr protein kinase)